MPAPIPIPVRRAIFQRSRTGATVATLAQAFALSERTVRHLVRRFDERGPAGLVPDYARCATKSAAPDNAVRQKALQMRAQHPGWGGGLIRIFVQEELGSCPCERTLQRWFRQAALTPAPAGRRPAGDESRAAEPHEVWQMDAAERLRLATGAQVSWLRIADECSGAVLQTRIFPPGVLEPG
jgi:transposase